MRNCGFCGNPLTSDKQRRAGQCAECLRAGEWLKGRRPRPRATAPSKPIEVKPADKA